MKNIQYDKGLLFVCFRAYYSGDLFSQPLKSDLDLDRCYVAMELFTNNSQP